jgi:hypothetical protein
MADVNEQKAATWAAFWRGKSLPILPETLAELGRQSRRIDRVQAAQIAEIVMADPLLAVQVLRFINQRERTSLAADIVSIEKAVMLMGVQPFFDRFSRLQSIETVMPADSPAAVQLQQLIIETDLLLRLSRELAEQRYDARPEEIIMAALLAKLNDMLTLLAPVLDSQAPPPASQLAPLLKVFRIPDVIVGLLEDRGEAVPRETLQLAIVSLLHHLRRGWWMPEIGHELARAAGALGCEPADVWQSCCRHMLALVREKHLRDYLPAICLPMQPGLWPAPATPQSKPEPRQDPLPRLMQALHLAAIKGASSNQVMNMALTALSEGLGMRRILFALHMPAERTLRARFLKGVASSDPLHDLVISLDKPHLLSQLLQKPQSVWFNRDNAARLLPLLPEILLKQSGQESFCLMSIFVGNKPLGVIYADRHGADAVTDDHYQHFKQICLLTGKALAAKPASSP